MTGMNQWVHERMSARAQGNEDSEEGWLTVSNADMDLGLGMNMSDRSII